MKTRVTVIRSTDAERKRWEKAAKKEGISVSEFLRRAGDERAQRNREAPCNTESK